MVVVVTLVIATMLGLLFDRQMSFVFLCSVISGFNNDFLIRLARDWYQKTLYTLLLTLDTQNHFQLKTLYTLLSFSQNPRPQHFRNS